MTGDIVDKTVTNRKIKLEFIFFLNHSLPKQQNDRACDLEVKKNQKKIVYISKTKLAVNKIAQQFVEFVKCK